VHVGIGDGARADRKAGDLVDTEVSIALDEPPPYVSRGGVKLAAALDAFGLDPAGRVCLDVGASTGGFTDVLLKHGAIRVYALDVGRGQLAERLLRDERVVTLDRTNARTLGPRSLPEWVAMATIDVSFVSLTLILGPVRTAFGSSGGDVIALVKPQFEAPKGSVDPDGVVRDPSVHREALARVIEGARRVGYVVQDAVASPLLGPAGNREFFVHLAIGPDAPAEPADLDARLDRVAEPV
jgi:23S rRNA (cytidine1920-2'-O)/16S rRNA (cytidine1409-2'-O)-methyltransferase